MNSKLEQWAKAYMNGSDSDLEAVNLIDDLLSEVGGLEDALELAQDSLKNKDDEIESLEYKISGMESEIWDLKERLEIF